VIRSAAGSDSLKDRPDPGLELFTKQGMDGGLGGGVVCCIAAGELLLYGPLAATEIRARDVMRGTEPAVRFNVSRWRWAGFMSNCPIVISWLIFVNACGWSRCCGRWWSLHWYSEFFNDRRHAGRRVGLSFRVAATSAPLAMLIGKLDDSALVARRAFFSRPHVVFPAMLYAPM